MNKNVIYTCLTGNYDGLKQPKYIYDGYDYICFSNEFSEYGKSVRYLLRQMTN